MYLIKGDENYFIAQKLQEIVAQIKSKNNNEIRLVNYSVDINSDKKITIEKLVSEIYDVDIFGLKKVIILQNIDFLNAKNKLSTDLLDGIINLLKAIDNDTEIIFTQYLEKYDKSFLPSKVFDFLLKNATIFECKKVSDKLLFNYVMKLIKEKNGTIDSLTLSNLLMYLPNDLQIIDNEITKLLLLNKNITNQMIDNSTLHISSNIDFAFSNAFVNYANIIDIFLKFKQQLDYGISASQIISQMANILYDAQWLYLLKSKYSTIEEINRVLNFHEYKLRLTNSFLDKISYEKIKKLLVKLAKLDKDIKQGQIDEIIGIKTFMLSLFE